MLKDFMEKSNLAEYEIRLDIIFVYHCHLVHLEASERRGKAYLLCFNFVLIFTWVGLCMLIVL